MAFAAGKQGGRFCKSVISAALMRNCSAPFTTSSRRTNALIRHASLHHHPSQLRTHHHLPFSTDAIDASTKNSPESSPSSSASSSSSTSAALKLSDACIQKVREICKDDHNAYLRVLVDGGGCSGFQYKFELDNNLQDDDVRFGPDGRVLIDAISLDYCAGATLDYSVELIKSGFRMVGNPKAEQGCSCGASFALKL